MTKGDIECVARAICTADTLAIGWEMQDDDCKARFRRMAKAAIQEYELVPAHARQR